MKNEKNTYIYIKEDHLAIKKNEIFASATTWMNLEGIIQSEKSQMSKT